MFGVDPSDINYFSREMFSAEVISQGKIFLSKDAPGRSGVVGLLSYDSKLPIFWCLELCF